MDNKELEHKFRFHEANKFMRYFIVEAASMVSRSRKKDIDQIWPEMFCGDETVKWKLKVQLNDIELPVVDIFKLMESSFEELVTDKAVELINDRIDDVSFIVDEMVETTHEKVEDLFNDIKNKTFKEVDDD
jgi:hypothetical protein